MLRDSRKVHSDLPSFIERSLLLLNLDIESVKQYLCCNSVFQVLISERKQSDITVFIG